MREEKLLVELDRLLEKAISQSLAPARGGKVGVVFSGGVDSALVAKVCLDLGKDITLYSAGLTGFFKDRPFVESFARKFKLPWVAIEVTKEEVISLIQPVSDILSSLGIAYANVKEFNPQQGWINQPLQVSLGIPFYLVAQAGKAEDFTHFVCAQAGDELFGGGYRHLQLPLEKLNDQLRHDFGRLLEVDHLRDSAMFSHFGGQLAYPLIESEWSEYVLSLKAEWKMRKDLGEIGRKYIWRRLALKREVPEENALRKKHAMQYSSGFWRVIKAYFRHLDKAASQSK